MITWGDLFNSMWLGGFLLLVGVCIFFICYVLVYIWFNLTLKASRRRAVILAGLLAGLPLSFTGIVAGFLTGASRSPAVSAIIPAILTFVGAMMVYMIGKGQLRALIAGFVVFVFSANLVVGTILGSASRDRWEEVLQSVQVRELKADQELKIRLHCVSLGLISDVSKPCPLGITPEKAQPAN